jgi:hypothetical protein
MYYSVLIHVCCAVGGRAGAGLPTNVGSRWKQLLKPMKTDRGRREVGDIRELNDSDYFLNHSFVNSFENEICQSGQAQTKEEPEEEEIGQDEGNITRLKI